PGAWEKVGLTYKLTEPASSEVDEAPRSPSPQRRREKLERLRFALRVYSMPRAGQLPTSKADNAIVPELWDLPDGNGVKYEYVPGLRMEFDNRPLAFEPPV